jgi:hypothetical protein
LLCNPFFRHLDCTRVAKSRSEKKNEPGERNTGAIAQMGETHYISFMKQTSCIFPSRVSRNHMLSARPLLRFAR